MALIKNSKVLSQTIMVYNHEKLPPIYPYGGQNLSKNYRVFTGNIGKGCMRSQEVNNKITPWSWVWIYIRYFKKYYFACWTKKGIFLCFELLRHVFFWVRLL